MRSDGAARRARERATPAALVAVTAAMLATGCFDNVETPFPPGLEPLEDEHLAPLPEPRDGEPYPEELVLVRSGALENPRVPAVHAAGYVREPIATVWEAMRNPDVGADRRVLASWTVTHDVEPEYDFSYVIHQVIVNVITIEYDVTWRHGVVEGTVDEPEIVAVRLQKTEGSTAVTDLRASFVLREVEPGVTSIEAIEYLNAVAGSHENLESFLRDFFAELVIVSHGGELPPIAEL